MKCEKRKLGEQEIRSQWLRNQPDICFVDEIDLCFFFFVCRGAVDGIDF